jgi:uncharacterized protein (TIGR02246 family)
MALSTADRLEIEQLYARYAHAFDGGDAEAFAAVFTADGRFTSGAAEPIVGREALAAFVRRRFAEAPGTSHHITNVLLEDAPEGGASGRAYGLILGTATDGRLQFRNAGLYVDELVREDGAWRIRSRTYASWVA